MSQMDPGFREDTDSNPGELERRVAALEYAMDHLCPFAYKRKPEQPAEPKPCPYSAGQLVERKRLTPAIREAARVLSACAFDAPEDQAAAAEIERVAEELERETT